MVRRAGRCARGRPGGRGGVGLHGGVRRALGCNGGPDHRLPARGRDRLPGTDLSLVPVLGRARSLERGEGPLSKEQVQSTPCLAGVRPTVTLRCYAFCVTLGSISGFCDAERQGLTLL